MFRDLYPFCLLKWKAKVITINIKQSLQLFFFFSYILLCKIVLYVELLICVLILCACSYLQTYGSIERTPSVQKQNAGFESILGSHVCRLEKQIT